MRFCPHCSAIFAIDARFCPEDGAELRPIQDPYLGRTVASRYRLIRRLGSGGMSIVYLAEHVMIERRSALKILRPDLARQPVHRERFLREARAVNRINHPNIVEISDVGESDGVAYLVMEYIDGPSVHEELARGPFDWVRAVRIGLQVAAALARAHQMGVIHRDLKPENLLLPRRVRDTAAFTTYPSAPHAEQDFVKLADFGIAKLVDEPMLTAGTQLFGTPGYIAPESLQGVTDDPRSDLYALGVILYEMTTGVLPFDASGGALLDACLRATAIPPSRRIADYPRGLETLVLALLARAKEDRPPDAFAVYDALFALLVPESTHAPLPPLPPLAFDAGRNPDPEPRDAVPGGDAGRPPARSTRDVSLSIKTGAARWTVEVGKLETAIREARSRRAPVGDVARADEIANLARDKVALLERVLRSIAAQQARVDALEGEGRSFRTDVGRALDQLVLDRSRERAQAEVLARRLATVASRPDRHSDAFLWETAALSADSGAFDITDEDLTFQIDALHRTLEERNVALEAELLEASGALEGSLAAARHLTHELERALRDAMNGLREPVPAVRIEEVIASREGRSRGSR